MEKFLRFVARPWAFAAICGLIVAVWAGWAFILRAFISDWSNRGLSGDMYGSLNALFTGLALAGLVYTIVLQKVALIDAARDATLNRFEATFFQLLRSVEGIVDAMDQSTGAGEDRVEFKGRDCFIQMFRLWDTRLRRSAYAGPSAVEKVRAEYDGFYNTFQTDLGHYYRSLYHIFKFVSVACPENDKFYAHFVRAQLSSQQLLLLFYNCISSYGEGFKCYVEEFSLLKHLPKGLIHDKSLLDFYDPKAYGD